MTLRAEPVIRGIIRAKLQVSFSLQDGDHLNQEALEIGSSVKGTIVAELQSLKERSQKTIKDFQSYVAVVTFNVGHDYLRRKYPRRGNNLSDEQAITYTDPMDFKIYLKNELQGTSKTLFAGRMNVKKVRVTEDLPVNRNFSVQ